MKPAITKVTILYDANCGLCRRLKKWILWQPAYVTLEALPMNSNEARERFPTLTKLIEKGKFVCIDSNGDVFIEEEARILCLWALKRYRRLSLQIANTPVKLLATNFFDIISRNRHSLSAVFGL